jgi:hypothetical protein
MYVDQNGQKQQTVNNEGVGQTTQSLTWLTTKEIQESGVDPSALHYLGRHTATACRCIAKSVADICQLGFGRHGGALLDLHRSMSAVISYSLMGGFDWGHGQASQMLFAAPVSG